MIHQYILISVAINKEKETLDDKNDLDTDGSYSDFMLESVIATMHRHFTDLKGVD